MKRSILITGCSSGIGLDAAKTLKSRGWRVFAACRKSADCERLREMGFESPRIDYEDAESIERAVEELLGATGGTLDALFNNGAYGIPAAVEDLPRAALSAILNANLIGPHHLTTRILPAMRAQGHGRIVNCTSVMGFTAYPWRGAYVATKFGLEGLTDTLRLELHNTPIHVCLIQPGLITTKFGENSGRNFERWIEWEHSAKAHEYRDDLLKKWERGNPHAWLEVPARDVTSKLIHAVESPRPRARYRVTRLAQVAYIAKRLLPTRGSDWLIRKLS